MSDTLFEYPISRFIEQYFYNSRLKDMNSSYICEHCPLRDYIRNFYMADGSIISFSFTTQDAYSIDLVNIKE